MKETERTVALLKKDDEKTIRDLYNEYRPGFLLFSNRYGLDKNQVLDIYQDAIIALCENAQKGHLDELTSSIKTYLFSIGKYMIFAQMRKKKRIDEFANILSAEGIQNILALRGDSNPNLAEKEDFAKRWLIVKEIKNGSTQREIAKKFGMSLCKITRASKELKKENSAFVRMLEKL